MSAERDSVIFNPNQRVDLPDLHALQANGRTAIRSSLASFMFGTTTTRADLKRTIGGWQVTEDSGGPSANIEVNFGTAMGGEVLGDGSEEYGVAFGREGATQQTVDLTSLGAATYSVYVRFVREAGTSGNRIFWDANASSEIVDTVATRSVVRWQVAVASAAPSVEYIKIAEVVWGGATVVDANITHTRWSFFEGDESASFAAEWGDGANDRSTDRGQYGVESLYQWTHAVRRQLAEIMGGGQKWYELPTLNIADHIADNTDPHGTTLIQTNIETASGNFVANDTSGELSLTGSSGSMSLTITVGSANLITAGGLDINIDADGELDLDGGNVAVNASTTLTLSANTDISLIALDDITLLATDIITIGSTNGTTITGPVTVTAATFSFASVVTRARALSGADFVGRQGPRGGPGVDLWYHDPTEPSRANSETGVSTGVAPIQLPQGAVVTDLVMYGEGATAASDLTVSLYRVAHGTTTKNLMASANASGSGALTATDSTISFATVDNSAYSYYVTATNGAIGVGDETSLDQVKVVFDVDDLAAGLG